MEWYHSESDVKPIQYDYTSSKAYIYLRKNIVHVDEVVDSEGEVIKPAHYEYDELLVPQEVKELLTRTDNNTTQIVELENTICELSMLGV